MSDLELPANAVVLSELRIIEYLDEDGEIYKVDFSSTSDASALPMSKALEMIEFARAFAISPMLAEMVLQFVNEDEDDE